MLTLVFFFLCRGSLHVGAQGQNLMLLSSRNGKPLSDGNENVFLCALFRGLLLTSASTRFSAATDTWSWQRFDGWVLSPKGKEEKNNLRQSCILCPSNLKKNGVTHGNSKSRKPCVAFHESCSSKNTFSTSLSQVKNDKIETRGVKRVASGQTRLPGGQWNDSAKCQNYTETEKVLYCWSCTYFFLKTFELDLLRDSHLRCTVPSHFGQRPSYTNIENIHTQSRQYNKEE